MWKEKIRTNIYVISTVLGLGLVGSLFLLLLLSVSPFVRE